MEPIYTVMIIILIIWAGIFGFMWHLSGQARELKSRLEKIEKSGNN